MKREVVVGSLVVYFSSMVDSTGFMESFLSDKIKLNGISIQFVQCVDNHVA